MKSFHFFILLVYTCIFLPSALGQNNIPDLKKANELRSKFPLSKVYSESYNSNYTFSFNKRSQGAQKIVTKKADDYELIAIKPTTSYLNTLYYDNQSSISIIKKRFKGESYKDVLFQDLAISENFTSDSRYKIFGHTFRSSGETIEFKTEKSIFDIMYFTSIYFHEFFPIKNRRIEIDVPNWLDIEFKEMNFEGYGIIKEIVRGKKSYKIIYTLENLIPIIKQENAPGLSHTLPHLLVISKSFTQDDFKTNILETIQDQYSWYKMLVDQVEVQPETFKNKVNELTSGLSTDKEKIKAIYYWIQDNIKYLAYEEGLAGFRPAPAKEVFIKRYGDCKGMANLSKEMLKLAGFDARLSWIGTKLIAYDYSTPSLAVDNHMICTVFLNGDTIFIDGTEKYSSIYLNGDRIQGKQVLIENGNSYILSRIPEFSCDSNLFKEKRNVEINGVNLIGTTQLEYNGESKKHILNNYHRLKSENKTAALREFLSSSKNEIILNESNSDLNVRDGKLGFNNEFIAKNAVILLDNEIYIDLNQHEPNPVFKFDSTRLFSYVFDWKVLNKKEIILKLPSGYKIKHLPKPVDITHEDFSIKLEYVVLNDEILYRYEFGIPNGIIHKRHFKEWNEAISELDQFCMDQIVLIKK
jgi:hypothetical protein